MARTEPVAHKFRLKNGFTTGCGDPPAGRVHKVAVSHHLFHQIFNGHFFAAVRIPSVTVVAVQAAHQAALEKGDKTDARAINSATGFKGVNATNN